MYAASQIDELIDNGECDYAQRVLDDTEFGVSVSERARLQRRIDEARERRRQFARPGNPPLTPFEDLVDLRGRCD